ncbi:MAG: hypothetical protein LBE18_08400 [Planctomycetaceae bacterium]|jgi:hypothetical protein|nr:hypothetical protein [Planctomycetaceae bacterium]
MRLPIFLWTLFFIIIFCRNHFVSANNTINNNETDAVNLRLDDDIDTKLNRNINLSNPNTSSVNNNSSNVKNSKEVKWGKSNAAKNSNESKSESKPKSESESKPESKSESNLTSTPNIRFAQKTPLNLTPDNLTSDNLTVPPNPKAATKVNNHYTDIPITTPKPLPQRKSSNSSPPNISPITHNPSSSYILKSSRTIGSVDLVETLLEVTGDVKQPAGNEQHNNVSEKMEVIAGFRYEERVNKLSDKGNSLMSVRQYNLAKAKMKIGKDLKTPELKDKIRTIVSCLEGDKVVLFSPNGALRCEELLLVEDLPGNTLTIDSLLPNKAVKVGDSWQISDSVLRSFLSIDAVIESQVNAVFTAVADNVAMIELVGDVKGLYLGAETKMSIQAKYQFDLNMRRINWLGILIQEDRSVGHVGPGFNLTARLQVKISPLEKSQNLTDEFIAGINVQANEKTLCLKYDGGKGAWNFIHDRNWYVFQDDPQTTILRRLHNGELVAQCNIADMGVVDVKTMTTLERFTKEISSGLGKSYRKVAAAEQYTNNAGYKVYTVMIDGAVEDLPLRWIYNLLTDQNGRQCVVVFVIEAKMLNVFGNSDDILLDTYRMIKKE